MEEFQFSRSFDNNNNMSVEVYVFMKALTYPVASENFIKLDKTLVRTFSSNFHYALL